MDTGHSKRIKVNLLPQGGYADDARSAVRLVEEHYDLEREREGERERERERSGRVAARS